jgi:hypothetical protein
LWLKRWAVLWSAGFALGVLVFFGSFAYRAWRVAGLSPAQRVEQAEAMLRFVGDQLRNHNGVGQIEKYFPDAGMVAYMVYGQALVNVGVAEQLRAGERRRLAEEIKWCLQQLAEPSVVDTFPDTQVPYGLFLLSRRTLLLAGLHLISDAVPDELTEEYHDNCRAMADAFNDSPHGLVDSFPRFCWPADNLAALRCLRLHDEKYETSYGTAVEKWKEWAEGALDPRSGMLPFRADSETGESLEPARGSSMAVCLIELRDVDNETFRQQYLHFRDRFGDSFLGIPTWREFPKGAVPQTDIDTGPIINGHGVLATLTGMIAAKLAGDNAVFCGPMGLIEAIARPSTENGMRRYFKGRALALDALAAYAMSAVPWTKAAGRIPRLSTPPKRPWLFLAALMAVPFLTMATAGLRYRRIVQKILPLSLWHSESPSSEGIVLFWSQLLLLVALFFTILWFPVIWAAFGIVGRGASRAFRFVKQGEPG